MKLPDARWLVFALAMTGLGACASAPQAPLHERLMVLDTHLDTPAVLMRPDWDISARHDVAQDYSQVDLPRMIEGGLDGGFWVVYTPQGPRTPEATQAALEAARARAVRIHTMVEGDPDHFALALRASDAARIARAGKRIVYLSIENSYPLSGDIARVQEFYDLGVRMIGPVHMANNDFADSATDPNGPEWHGLSPLGRQLVAEANRLGMILDASHASDDVFDQMLELSETPIILSHSGPRAVHDHPRNISDERMRRLARAGGVMQVNTLYIKDLPMTQERRDALVSLRARFGPETNMTFEQYEDYLAARRAIDARYPPSEASFEDFMRSLLHALRVMGPEHVGIGADWDGGGGVAGLEDVSALPRITERLVAAGYRESDLRNIWGGNVLRLLRIAEERAQR